ncbi:MAG: hypothetical protein ACKO1W_09110, partial [Microcystaceae cyanobacterium]
SLQGSVPGEIIVSTLQGNNTTGQQTFTTLTDAFTALSTGIGNVANIPNELSLCKWGKSESI